MNRQIRSAIVTGVLVLGTLHAGAASAATNIYLPGASPEAFADAIVNDPGVLAGSEIGNRKIEFDGPWGDAYWVIQSFEAHPGPGPLGYVDAVMYSVIYPEGHSSHQVYVDGPVVEGSFTVHFYADGNGGTVAVDDASKLYGKIPFTTTMIRWTHAAVIESNLEDLEDTL
jgi:hypothetical protein